MLKKIATATAVLALSGLGLSNASADQGGVYDGTRDSYAMTGIQKVYAQTEDGTGIYLDVWSMDACAEEDGTGDPCVWHSPSRGSFTGASYVQVGTEADRKFAYINHEAARVLLKPSAPVVNVQETAPVVQVETAPVEPSAPVQEDITDAELSQLGYVETATGWESSEPVQAIDQPCSKPYGPDLIVCNGIITDAFTGETVEAPAMLRTVGGQPYQDVTAKKVRTCEPGVWTTHCATVETGTGTPVFITENGTDHIELPGFELVSYGDTGVFVQR